MWESTTCSRRHRFDQNIHKKRSFRQKRPNTFSPHSQPLKKRQRQDYHSKINVNSPKKQCWRCGKLRHPSKDCKSRMDINYNKLQLWERRKLSEMPFRTSNVKRKIPPQPKSPNDKPWLTCRDNQQNSLDPNTHSNSNNKSNENSDKHLHTLIAKLAKNANEDPHVPPAQRAIITQLMNGSN